MTEQITVSKIYFNAAKKDGTPYLDKNQRPYQMVKLVASDGRTLWGRAYQGSPILSWRQGDTHEVEIHTSGNFLNFRLPKYESAGGEEVTKLWAAVNNIDRRVRALEEPSEVQEHAPTEEDLPF